MEKENKKWILLSLLGGSLMIFGATAGNLMIFIFFSELAKDYIKNEFLETTLFFAFIFFGIIAGTGGISVIVGTLLIVVNHFKLGKFLSLLGTGIGLTGLVLFIVVEIIFLVIIGHMLGFIAIFLGVTSICEVAGFSGFLMAIISRKKLKKPETIL